MSDSASLLTTLQDGLSGLLRQSDFVLEEVGGGERVVSSNCARSASSE
jgi:hypothetical protein